MNPLDGMLSSGHEVGRLIRQAPRYLWLEMLLPLQTARDLCPKCTFSVIVSLKDVGWLVINDSVPRTAEASDREELGDGEYPMEQCLL